jgi:hypothetical protein
MNLSYVTTAFQPFYYTTGEPIRGYYKRFWHFVIFKKQVFY